MKSPASFEVGSEEKNQLWKGEKKVSGRPRSAQQRAWTYTMSRKMEAAKTATNCTNTSQ